jgi:hypothetical protein
MPGLLNGMPVSAQESHLLVVSGVGGEPKYSEAFHEWSLALLDAAVKRFGVPAANVRYLAEQPEKDPVRIQGKSTRENVEKALLELARLASAGDHVFIVLFGHGSSPGREPGEARFNLPGPDLTADQYRFLIDEFKSQKLAFINTASASGDFLKVLSGPNRVVVTATKSGMERNETIFGRYWVEAFTSEGADVDKDGRVSMLEAFDFARQQVVRFYEEGNRLQTEHPVLDDDGDGKGSATPDAKAGDGAVARTLSFSEGRATARVAASDPELLALIREKRETEERIEALKLQKDAMVEEDYTAQLEELLVELALKNKAIKEREGK